MQVKEALAALGLREGATLEEMRSAFKRRILRAHPDKADAGQEAAAKVETQTLLLARDRLLASNGLKRVRLHAKAQPRTSSSSSSDPDETKWRAQCAQRRAHTAEARERLWQTNRAKAQEARAEEWRANVRTTRTED